MAMITAEQVAAAYAALATGQRDRIVQYWAEDMRWLVAGALLTCLGVAFNRFVFTLQTLSVPTMAFDSFMIYWPSWQEWAVLAGVVAYGVILYSFSFRYLNLFPRERELQPSVGRS